MTDDPPITTACELCGADQRGAVPGRDASVMRCLGCKLIHRYPRPRASDLSDHYREDYYVEQERVGSERIASARHGVYRQALDDWRRRGLGGRLLDVGAGYGDFVRLAVDAGFDAIGVEISPMACQAAKQRLGVRLIPGVLGDEIRAEGRFDVITLWNVLDQMASPRTELARIRDLLVPGGLLAIRVPNASFQVFAHRWYRRLEWILHRCDIADPSVFMTYSYSAATLRAFLEQSGFVAVAIHNAKLTTGDPYRSLSLGEGGAALIKSAVSVLADALSVVSPDHRIAPSLYAEALTPNPAR